MTVDEPAVVGSSSKSKLSSILSDIVYLGVLHTEHWKVGLLFLEAGKNVLCEKPFAMNSKQVKELVATAKRNNVFLMEVKMGACAPLSKPCCQEVKKTKTVGIG